MSERTKNRRSAWVSGKEEYGFKSEAEIPKLKSRLITVEVHIGNAPCEEIFHLAPRERLKVQSEWYKAQLQKLVALPIFKQITQTKLTKSYASFTTILMASQLPRLLKEKSVSYISLLAIEGRRKRNLHPRKTLDWYAVKGVYAIQVEGATKGMQSYEERILLVRATSFDEAEKKAWKESENYVTPYLNSNGEMVRWQLEKIVDIYWTSIDVDGFNPHGTEVFSALHQRRMKPEYEWHPRKQVDDTQK